MTLSSLPSFYRGHYLQGPLCSCLESKTVLKRTNNDTDILSDYFANHLQIIGEINFSLRARLP
jgi:hypothetical protein